MKRLCLFFFAIILFQISFAQSRTITLKLIHTTDVHGSYFPYDFSKRMNDKGSLTRVSSYIKSQRKIYHQNVLLFDNGDILQGQPSSYYYNYIDTSSVHLCAAMMNEIKL